MTNRLEHWLWRCWLFLVASAVYLYGFPAATMLYESIVLLHVAAGIAFCMMLAWLLLRRLRDEPGLAKLGWMLLAAGALLGLILIKTGTPIRLKSWLYAH